MQTADTSLCPYLWKEREGALGGPFLSTGALIPFMKTSSSGPTRLPKAPPPHTITPGVGISAYGFGGGGIISLFHSSTQMSSLLCSGSNTATASALSLSFPPSSLFYLLPSNDFWSELFRGERGIKRKRKRKRDCFLFF